MRVGFVTTSYPRFAGDPAGSFVAAHAAAVRALGHDVEVIAAGDGPRKRGAFDLGFRLSSRRRTAERSIGLGTGRVPDTRLFYRGGAPEALERGGVRTALAAAAFTARLTAAVAARASRWDLIVAHWLAPSAIAALPSRVPLLAIAHGGDVHALRRAKLLAPLLAALRLRGAKLAFVSAELLELARAAAPSLARWLDTAAIVQSMGVDVARFAAIGRAPETPPIVAVIGRLVAVKGVDVALAALPAGARLVIAGDGPARAELQRVARDQRDVGPTRSGWIDRRDVRPASSSAGAWIDRVQFVGELDAARRDQLLRAASVVAIPSRVLANGRSEGTPVVALEALAAGVPVVASAVGGLRDLPVALVPPDDPRALAAALARCLADPPAAATLRRAAAAFDWASVTARLHGHAGYGCATATPAHGP